MTDESNDEGVDDSDDQQDGENVSKSFDYGDMDEDIWKDVYGHDGAKAITAAALRQGDVHVLYEGPSGSGKSVMLMALEERVPGVLYRDGKNLTGSKLRDVLKSDPPILLIDEIDALDSKAYDILSIPMEHGRLVRDSARESYDVDVGTQVIGACNHADALPEHIKNRFRVLKLDKYSEQEYLDLCSEMLPERVEWVADENEGRRVAKKVLEITETADPRNARDIARMARSLDDIDVLAKALHDPEAELEVGPLFPGEVKRAQGEVGKVHLRRVLVDDMMEEASKHTGDGGGDGGDGEEELDKEAIESEIEDAISAAT